MRTSAFFEQHNTKIEKVKRAEDTFDVFFSTWDSTAPTEMSARRDYPVQRCLAQRQRR